jgi:hypothetical protein
MHMKLRQRAKKNDADAMLRKSNADAHEEGKQGGTHDWFGEAFVCPSASSASSRQFDAAGINFGPARKHDEAGDNKQSGWQVEEDAVS